MMPQIRQGPLNAAIAPRGILLGHADHELFNPPRDTRAAKLLTMPAPIELLGDQALVPPHEGVGGGEGRHHFETLAAKRVSEHREATMFRVRQAQPAALELSFQDTVFLHKVGDHLLLVLLYPASNHGNEYVQDHGVSSR
jgi:hypothetical protein